MADQNIVKESIQLDPMEAPRVTQASVGPRNTEESENEEAGLKKDIRDLEFILDLPLEVSVELGRAKMLINDLLQLGQGSVVELNKFAGEPLEILVNNRLVARGEAVVVNEKFGVRITDIVSPMERVKQLG